MCGTGPGRKLGTTALSSQADTVPCELSEVAEIPSSAGGLGAELLESRRSNG